MLLKITSNLCRLTLTPFRQFGMLNDYLSQKTMKKQQAEFKKEMEYLANKPTFTLMDYKQRIEDELARANSNIRSKVNKDHQEQTRNLEMEKKVLNSFFEEELNLQKKIKEEQKKEVSLVSQLPLDFFDEYRTMHRVLRNIRLRNEPLPQTVEELRQLYINNPAARSSKKMRYLQYRRVSTKQRTNYMKKEFNHGYFDV